MPVLPCLRLALVSGFSGQGQAFLNPGMAGTR